MADYPYTTVPGKIKTLLAKIREVGIPQTVTNQWLKTVGFMSSNDRSRGNVLKALGFTDSSGVPTPKWKEYRGASHKQVLGVAIRECYADLFEIYSDADKRSQSELEHVFSTNSSSGKQVTAKTVSTFKSLLEQAEFAPANEQNAAASPPDVPAGQASPSARRTPADAPSLHIDIQVHISPEASPDQIEHVFASMAKHLYGAKKAD